MVETRKLAAILAADVVGYSKLAGSDEERTLARLRTLWSDLIAPTIAVHNGRVVKRTGDGSIIEFRSVVDAVRCAIEVQNGMIERNAGLPPERRIEFRVGIHLGDVVEESDGDLMGDGVNIAARLEGIADPGGICLSEDAYRQVRDRVTNGFVDLGEKELKNIARPLRAYAVKTGSAGLAATPHASALERPSPPRLSIVVLPFANLGGDPEQEYFVDGVAESLTTDLSRIAEFIRDSAQYGFYLQGEALRRKTDWARAERAVCVGGQRSARRKSYARQRPAHRCRDRGASVGRAFRHARCRSIRDARRNCRSACQSTWDTVDCRRGATRGTGTSPQLNGLLLSRHGLGEQGLESEPYYASAWLL